MKNGRKILITMLVGLVLVGCKTASDSFGQGPINISSNIVASFEKYKSGPGPSYFAISEDGRRAGWSYCTAGPDGCMGGGLPFSIAINACQRNSDIPCKIYARGTKVVWNGPISGAGTAKDGGKSNDVVCGYAVDYSTDAPKWTENPELQKYVKTAKSRGFSIEKCDELN